MEQADQGAPAAAMLKINPKTLAVGQLRIPGRAAAPIAVAEAQPSLDVVWLKLKEGPEMLLGLGVILRLDSDGRGELMGQGQLGRDLEGFYASSTGKRKLPSLEGLLAFHEEPFGATTHHGPR
jgi:hypothetical protein